MCEKILSPVRISHETIQDFSVFLQTKNCVNTTISKYIADLKTFYNFLPEETVTDKTTAKEGKKKVLSVNSLPEWRDHLIARGLAPRTINTRIAACNNLLSYLNRKDWQVSPISLVDVDSTPPVSREEYYKLLEAACDTDNERLYFMIKAFCCLGLSLMELPCLTVEGVVTGEILVETKRRIKRIIIPKSLQDEFLNFARRNGINSGSLFKSKIGFPLTRNLVMKELSDLCVVAKVRQELGSPRKLQELYFKTFSDLRSQVPLFIENEFSKLIESEQYSVGWEQIAR